MRRTQPTILALLFLSGGGITYLCLQLLFRSGRALPRLPWTSAPLLLFLAIVLFLTAFNVSRRLEELKKSKEKKTQSQYKPINPIFLARLVLLAKSAAHAGSLLGGIYAGVFLGYLVDLPNSDFIWNSIFDAFSALLVAIGGYVLERVLTIKDDGKAI